MRGSRAGLIAALYAAALAGGASIPGQPSPNIVISGSSGGPGASPAGMEGNKSSRLSRLAEFLGGGGGGFFGRPTRPTYLNNFPVSVAEGKRRARKRRNKLRARGHHRKAVR